MYKLSEYFDEILKFSSVKTDLEVKTLDSIFKKNGAVSILDIACGVGRHSIPLTKLGYKVVGLDYSPYQIRQAKINAKRNKVCPKFLIKDANSFISKQRFDAAICMWSTLGEEPMQYQKVIKNTYQSLKDHGIFVIDNKNWETVKINTNTRNDYFTSAKLTIKKRMQDRYSDHFRIRQTMFEINGKKYNDLCITHLLSTKEWIKELKDAGFKKFQIYYDYKKSPSKRPKRVLIVARK